MVSSGVTCCRDVNDYVNDLFQHIDKRCGLRLDFLKSSNLVWVHTVCYIEVLKRIADAIQQTTFRCDKQQKNKIMHLSPVNT